MPARRRAPSGCGPQARWLCCSLLTYCPVCSSLAPRQRAWGPAAKCKRYPLTGPYFAFPLIAFLYVSVGPVARYQIGVVIFLKYIGACLVPAGRKMAQLFVMICFSPPIHTST